MIHTLAYLRTITAGIAATIWRVITNRRCPCDLCTQHAQFIRASVNLYRAEVRGLPRPGEPC